MKKNLLLLFLFPFSLLSQPALLPHIGLTSAPLSTDPVCPIPVYTGEMDSSGYAEGDLVPDFTLYKTNGDSVRLREALSNGKPVLLVAGNYTCPIFRQKIQALNDIATYYAGQLQVYLIYVVEAHPVIDPSPYSGFVWTTSDNYSEGVLYEQPDTYGERLEMIDSLLAHYSIVPEILADGPCNNWWQNFGPAPNNAYLIDTNGIVRAKQGWFNRAPDNMWCEIDSLLGTNSGNCITVGNNGYISFTLNTGDSVATGIPTDILSIYGTLHNLSSTDNAEVMISKQIISVPADWQTALCADICYAPTVSSTTVTIPPSSDLSFIFHFYSGASADTGMAKIRFKNINIAGNTIIQRYYGITEADVTGVSGLKPLSVHTFPNPMQDIFYIRTPYEMQGEFFYLIDQLGRLVISGRITSDKTIVSCEGIEKGVYYLIVNGMHSRIIKN
jgi:hypothetical protein